MTDSWRPFEPSKDETKRIEDDRDRNRCNLHDDCAAADAKVRAAGGRPSRSRDAAPSQVVLTAYHCSVDDCEDCFGC